MFTQMSINSCTLEMLDSGGTGGMCCTYLSFLLQDWGNRRNWTKWPLWSIGKFFTSGFFLGVSGRGFYGKLSGVSRPYNSSKYRWSWGHGGCTSVLKGVSKCSHHRRSADGPVSAGSGWCSWPWRFLTQWPDWEVHPGHSQRMLVDVPLEKGALSSLWTEPDGSETVPAVGLCAMNSNCNASSWGLLVLSTGVQGRSSQPLRAASLYTLAFVLTSSACNHFMLLHMASYNLVLLSSGSNHFLLLHTEQY